MTVTTGFRITIPRGEDPTCLVRIVEGMLQTIERHKHVSGVPVQVDPPYDDVFDSGLRVLPTTTLKDELCSLLGRENVLVLSRRLRQSIPLRVRYGIFKRDRYRCQLCGASPANDPTVVLEVDHKIPIARGGTNNELNLWTLCRPCNNGKSADDL